MSKLKVFGGNLDGRHRVILACGSLTEFCRATTISRNHACETGNSIEIGVAMNEPGVLFINHHGGEQPYRSIGRFMDYAAVLAYDKEFPR